MIRNRRTLTYIAIALIVGVSLAFAVALSRTDSSASTVSQTQVTGGTLSESVIADDALAADPARKQPSLDQFTSKDPFVPLDVASNTGTTGTGGTTNTSGNTSLSAKIKVNGTAYTVSAGDKVPGSDPVFDVSAVTSSDVTFKLISGQFSDGSDTVTVAVGESVKVVNSDNDKSYTLAVTSIGSNTGGGGGSSTSASGHSITVLSISSQNGKAMVDIKVDGTTYSDKEQGDTFTTSWGAIKILSVNVGTQTVVMMHGDVTLTLQAGQVVVK